MLFVLSPAKSLDYDSPAAAAAHSTPLFPSDSAELIALLKTQSPQQIAALMGISDKLALLNVGRYAAWSKKASLDNARQAVLAFDGDVYDGLSARTLSSQQLDWAQQHLCILSGLYGVLRPLDLLQPYRLEMGIKLANARGRDLYQFWGSQIAQYLNTRLQEQGGEPVLVNLASQEYFKSVSGKLKARLITPVFKDEKNGQYKVISFYAKRARGLMVRYAAEQQISEPEDLKAFDLEGYAYNAAASNEKEWVFLRAEQK